MLGPDCSGRQVYDEISPAVCGVLQGQYVCVMAYGQTGAGKTFTMQGGGATQPGVVQLAAEELFYEAGLLQAAKRQQGQSLTMRLEVTLVEIYNEKLIDLLAEPVPNPHPHPDPDPNNPNLTLDLTLTLAQAAETLTLIWP